MEHNERFSLTSRRAPEPTKAEMLSVIRDCKKWIRDDIRNHGGHEDAGTKALLKRINQIVKEADK